MKKNEDSIETMLSSDIVDVIKVKKNSKSTSCLVQYSGKFLGKRFDLNKAEITIGRGRSCDVKIEEDGPDKTISREHAMISMGSGKIILIDLKSTNKTFVNEKEIKKTKLKDGDLIRLGHNIILKYFSKGNIERTFHDKIYKLATIDALTQIFNKKYFLEQLSSLFMKSKNEQIGFPSLIIFDIDHFKTTNDTYGHPAGDFILKELCRTIKDALRERDIFARYGGEEFIILLPDTPIDIAFNVAERVRKTADDHKFLYKNKSIPTTISLGVTSYENSFSKKEDLIAAADKKLYLSKKLGRNRVT